MNKQRGLFNQMLVLGIVFILIGMSVVSSFGLVLEKESSVELIIDGPNYGKVEEPLEYIFILSGIEGWDFWLFIDWDDESSGEWYGPYLSEEEISFIHTWYECDVYNIQAIAHVINGSSFNASLEVTIGNIYGIPITVHEAWELLNDVSNGIQIPIDIRSDEEWNESFIDTPYPEHPVHFSLAKLQTPEGLYEFIETYENKEIIPYSSANGVRFLKILLILIDAGYSGTIYYWDGGFNAWVDEDFPIRNNTPPNKPEIVGPAKLRIGVNMTFEITSKDPDRDNISYFIDWNDSTTDLFGPYLSGEIIEVLHIFYEKRDYIIGFKAIDHPYGAESDWEYIWLRWRARNRIIPCSLFQWFVDKFPLLEAFLRIMNL